MKFTTEKRTETSEVVRFTEKNKNGETLEIWLTKCEDFNNHASLPKLWKKHGYIDRILPNYWHLETFCRNKSGCWGFYNPQQKLHESGERYEIDFNWLFEATSENKEKLINEVYRLFTN